MKKVKLIYNPFSGHNKIINEIDEIIKVYQKYGYQLIPFRISFESKLEDAFCDLKDGTWDHLVLAGGDGSVSDSINMMKIKSIDLPVGILPTGTANDFAKCIGMPEEIGNACEQIINSYPQKIDLGKVNDRYFINILSFGLFTEVSQNTPTNLKNTMGKIAYYLNGIKELPKFRKFKISIDGGDYKFDGEAILVFVFNGRTAGNINISYKSSVDDGLLDVIVVKADLVNTTKSLINFLLKSHLEEENDGVVYFKSKKLDIKCDANWIKTDIDGEKGPIFPLDISCENESLRILGYKDVKMEDKQFEKFLKTIKLNISKKNIHN